ncbi:Tyrosinase family protein [Lysobacter dokdonensis DS-58]|uniref:Tyrosinase family protein n=1 Tax=Lysobacter dokdonensis DS-58 TaxID=1300345 RepID=A0A0A2WKA0_9GAMM|nr:tyrosinase family protein [Lysobacter dokdonensis]KGQ20218.1 Tyrosinase family protein [Lysobacter dokdonensis DS-58]
MISLSRRRFLQGASAMPLATWLSSNAFAQSLPLVRYDIASPQGLDMLTTYANAMRTMLAKPETDPTSWLWQWYSHFVNGATTKAAELTRIFGTTVTPQSTLANEMWNTCQSHAGQNTNHFLPWHRMFVFFFEQIIREVSGRPDFTLPYWDYTSADPLKRGIVPLQFRLKLDPVFNVLYRADRTTLANTGQRIDKTQPTDQMDISATMACAAYSTVGTVLGFCRSIDSNIHGRIHVLVGNAKNMGAVPYAARDPLFWVHHSNIDRLWESWNKNYAGVNPVSTWGNTQFVFADRLGQRVTGRLKEFFDLGLLGYQYDQLVAPPPPPPPPPETPPAAGQTTPKKKKTVAPSNAQRVAALMVSPPERVASSLKMAELGAANTRVTVQRLAAARQISPMLGLVPATAPQRTYLVLKNLHTWKQPEVLYHVYLGPAKGNALNKNTYVGAINFFDAEFHDHGGHGAKLDTALGENFFSFDVTDLLRRFERGGAVARNALQVTFVPGGKPTQGAGSMVATIELVRQ